MKTGPFKMKSFSGFGNLVENARKMSGSLTAGQAANVIEEMKTGSMSAPENKISKGKAPSGNYLERRKKKNNEKKKQFKVKVEPPLSGSKQIGAVANASTNRKTRRKLKRQQFAQSLKQTK